MGPEAMNATLPNTEAEQLSSDLAGLKAGERIQLLHQRYGRRLVASTTMLIGYSILAVPTGILTVEIGQAAQRRRTTDPGEDGAPSDPAARCPHCGARQ